MSSRLAKVVAFAAAASGLIAATGAIQNSRAATGGLVAAYSFNEVAGTVVHDSSGNGNDGTIANAGWATGKFGGALSFNGTSARVNVPSSASLQLTSQLTLEAWVNPASVTRAWRGVIYKGDDNYYLEATSNYLGRTAGGGTFGGVNANTWAPAALPANAWSHLALTYDGATLRLYLNGAQVASQARTGAIATSTNQLQIGGDSIYGQYFSGLIDEVRVYNVALSAAQIQADMTTPVGGSTDTTPPSAPGALGSSVIGSGEIDLSWGAASDNVGVTGYQVLRCTGPGCASFALLAQPAGTATTYKDTAVAPSTSYGYQVRAVDAAGNLGAVSNATSATTAAAADTQPPSTPAGLAASGVGQTSMSLSWSASSDNVGVTGYRLFVGGSQAGTSLSTSYLFSGLSCGSSYSLGVAAVDAANNVSATATIGQQTAACSDTTPPSAPGALGSSVIGSGEIDLSWGAASDNVGVTGYQVLRCTGPGCASFALLAQPAGTATTYKDTAVAPSTSYGYQVRAVDAAGNLGAVSNATSATTAAAADTQPPSTPAGLAASGVGQTSMSLSWSASSDNVGVTGYRLFVGGSQVGTSLSTSYLFSGLSCGSSYSLGVAAVDAANNVSATATIGQQTAACSDTTPPSAPGALGSSVIGSGEIDLSWGAASDNVGVTGYQVLRCTGPGCASFALLAQPAGTATTYKDTAVAPSTSYGYQVRAVDAAGNLGAVSNSSVGTTQAAGPSGLVAAYSFNAGSGAATVDASGNGNTGALAGATWTGAGRFGGALTFNGTSARVDVPNTSSLQLSSGTTLEAWVNPASVSSAWRDVIYKGDDNYYLEGTSDHAGGPAGGGTFSGGHMNTYAASALPANTWSHLALTYDGSTIRLYVNGAMIASQAKTGAITTSTNQLQIGGDSLYGQNFNGMIDEVRVYNTALSAAAIQNDMTTPIGSGSSDTSPPSMPTGLATSGAAQTTMSLSWAASTDNVGVTGYRMYKNGAQVAVSSATSYLFSGLTCGTSYTLGVAAADGAGNVSATNTMTTQTTACSADTTPPSVPSGLGASGVGQSSVTLSWVASSDNVGVTGYRLFVNGSQVGTSLSTSYLFSSLSCATAYTLGVAAVDAAGNVSAAGTLVVSTAACSGGGGSVFLSPAGSDASCVRGDVSKPCSTPGKAWSIAQAGDTISVANGDYTSGCTLSGAKSSDVTFSGSLSARFVCQLTFSAGDLHAVVDGISVYQVLGSAGSNYVTIKNGAVTCADSAPYALYTPDSFCSAKISINGPSAHWLFLNEPIGPSYDSESVCGGNSPNISALWGNVSDITFRNVLFHDVRYGCAAQHTENFRADAGGGAVMSNVTFDGVTFFNGANSGLHANGGGPDTSSLFLTGPGTMTGLVIQNSVFYGFGNYGIDGAVDLAITNSNLRNNTFERSAIFQCDASHCPGGYPQTFKITNNIGPNQSCMIGPALGSSGGYFRNNMWFYNGTGGSADKCDPSDLSVNGTGIVNSIFTNYAGYDFTLKPGSLAQNVGSTTPGEYATTDIDGNNRPCGTAPDVGMHERCP